MAGGASLASGFPGRVGSSTAEHGMTGIGREVVGAHKDRQQQRGWAPHRDACIAVVGRGADTTVTSARGK